MTIVRLGAEAGVVHPGTVRDPALDHEVAPHLVGVIAQVVALFGHDSMLPPGRAAPHRVHFGLGELTADAANWTVVGSERTKFQCWRSPGLA